jgi:hypothetical protein
MWVNKGLIVINWENHQTTHVNWCVVANHVKKLNVPSHYCL